MLDHVDLLTAYDDQLRTEAELMGAITTDRLGPLHLAIFPGGQGHVTYRDFDGAQAAGVRELVEAALEHFESDDTVSCVEWKTRGHDVAPGLHQALVDHGFVAGDSESVMVGRAQLLIADVQLPVGVTVREIHERGDVEAMCAMQAAVFGEATQGSERVDGLLQRMSTGSGVRMWIAEIGGHVVSAGRLEPVEHSDFAGIWGGATVARWRGQGIYRALTSERARAALAMGRTLIHSDSTADSRPILERAGLVAVTTTTPYLWHRR